MCECIGCTFLLSSTGHCDALELLFIIFIRSSMMSSMSLISSTDVADAKMTSGAFLDKT